MLLIPYIFAKIVIHALLVQYSVSSALIVLV